MQTPYDGRFKTLAEEYPDLLLRLLGVLGTGTKTPPVHLLRELRLDSVQVDHIYRIGEEDSGCVVHFEAVTSWDSSRVSRLALYRFLLRQKFRVPVWSYLVLMAQKYAPKSLPETLSYADDELTVTTRYNVIRLWEIDPSIAFAPGCEPLLPWVPLLRGGLPEFGRSTAAIEALFERRDPLPYRLDVMVSDLATLATLRYDKNTIGRFLEGLAKKIMLSSDVFRESWLYQDGVTAGKAEGKAEGKVEGKQASLRLALSKRFPEIGPLPEIDKIDRPELLDQLLLATFDVQSADEIRSAIQAALHVN